MGCLRGPGFQSVQKVSRERLGDSGETLRTLFGPEDALSRTLPRTPPVFGDTLGNTLGPKGPRDCCSRPQGSQFLVTNRPKEEGFGTDIPRISGGHSRRYPGPKLRSGRSKSLKNRHFGADIHDLRAVDVHDPKGFPKASV